jgi:hypothetical protein
MAELELLTLDLHSSIAYEGLENPPLAGAPLDGTALLPSREGGFREVKLGWDMAEGEEEVFLFDAEELVAFDHDEGPALRRPLPRPRYYGHRPVQGGSDSTVLSIASYAFLQWRPADEQEQSAGIEWFAREAWWERVEASGPYILRRVREDGKLATQLLRRMSAPRNRA